MNTQSPIAVIAPRPQKRCTVGRHLAPCERPRANVSRWTGPGRPIAAEVGQWRRGPTVQYAPILYVDSIVEDRCDRTMVAVVSTWNERGCEVVGRRRCDPMLMARDYPEVISEADARVEIAKLADAHRLAMVERMNRQREADEAHQRAREMPVMVLDAPREPQSAPERDGRWVERTPSKRSVGALGLMAMVIAMTAGMDLGDDPEPRSDR